MERYRVGPGKFNHPTPAPVSGSRVPTQKPRGGGCRARGARS